MRAFLAVLAVVLFFVLISCSPEASSPIASADSKDDASIQSTTVTHATYATAGVASNTCISELVDYSGTLKFTTKSKQLGNGSTSHAIRSDIKAKGVGRVSGDDYEIMSTTGTGFEYEVGPPYPRVITFDLVRKMVSKGSADNFWVTFTNTLTYDASGDLISVDITSSSECR